MGAVNSGSQTQVDISEIVRFLKSQVYSMRAEGKNSFSVYLYQREEHIRIVVASTGESVSVMDRRLRGVNGVKYFIHWFKYNLEDALRSLDWAAAEIGEMVDPDDSEKSYLEYRLTPP